jgi:hypothetical protein
MSGLNLFDLMYFSMTGSLACAMSAALLRKRTLSVICGSLSTICGLALFILIICKAERLPLFGKFESLITIVLVMNILSLLNDVFIRAKNDISPWAWGLNLIILFILYFYPRSLNPDFYMYDDFRVMIFFHFRILASAVFLFSAIIFWAGFYRSHPGYERRAGNWMLTGAVLFLISEFSGSWWCLDWLGDSWQWSKGFLKASTVFLTAMLSCHIPANWNMSDEIRGIIGSLPAAGTLWVLFLH